MMFNRICKSYVVWSLIQAVLPPGFILFLSYCVFEMFVLKVYFDECFFTELCKQFIKLFEYECFYRYYRCIWRGNTRYQRWLCYCAAIYFIPACKHYQDNGLFDAVSIRTITRLIWFWNKQLFLVILSLSVFLRFKFHGHSIFLTRNVSYYYFYFPTECRGSFQFHTFK